MSHLTLEALARLVDEAPAATELDHLDRCVACRDELRAMKEQKESLAALPAVLPAPDRWTDIRETLRADGLSRTRPAALRPRRWLQVAASVALLLAGGAGGYVIRGLDAPSPVATPSPAETVLAADDAPAGGPAADVPELALEPQDAFEQALDRFMETNAPPSNDPAARLALLDHIVASAGAALAEAPGDPVINGYYLTAVSQRNATLRQLSASRDPVF